MDMQKYLTEVLSGVGVPISFVARGEGRLPLLIYNFKEVPKTFWDNKEQVTRFAITINLFSSDNFIDLKKKTIEVMLDAGFQKVEIPQCIYMEDVKIFNQPMAFDYYHENINEN